MFFALSVSVRACLCLFVSLCLCFYAPTPASPAALPHMTAVLQARPPSFPSLEVACDWAVRSSTCKNREMAGVSLPSQLKQVCLQTHIGLLI